MNSLNRRRWLALLASLLMVVASLQVFSFVKDEKKKKDEGDERIKQLHEQAEQLEKKAATLRADVNALIEQRTEKEKSVPAEWLEKYSMMRARVSDPVVPIVHQSCSACSQMITKQDDTRAKRGALIQCQQCFRLLYAPEVMEKHADNTQSS